MTARIHCYRIMLSWWGLAIPLRHHGFVVRELRRRFSLSLIRLRRNEDTGEPCDRLDACCCEAEACAALRLLIDHPWTAITKAVRSAPNRRRMAIAYCGRGASKLLPLRKSNVLVLGFSEGAPCAGLACPDILAPLGRSVVVHSIANLHAKVLVAAKSAFAGSANAPRSSADILVEVVLQSSDPRLVGRSTHLVESLRGEPVSIDEARKSIPLWTPREYWRRSKPPKPPTTVPPGRARTWVVQLGSGSWHEPDRAARQKGQPVARGRWKSSWCFEVDEFRWSGPTCELPIKPAERVVQVLEESPGCDLVSPAARMLYLKNHSDPGGGRRSIVFVGVSRALRRKRLQRVREALGRAANQLRSKSHLALLRDAGFIHDLHQIRPIFS